jgi:hypothetical protein
VTEVNKERVQLLVDALKSGLYEKGIGKLHILPTDARPEGWCCLGVASDVAAKNGLEITRENSRMGGINCESFDGEMGYMPALVRKWYGFLAGNPSLKLPDGSSDSAASVNDCGVKVSPTKEDPYPPNRQLTLPEIGELFESTYLGEEEK